MPVLELLKEKGVLASYTSPAASGYPKWANNDGKIQSFGIEYAALIYNKELVKPADVPKKYEDLTDPKWKGKIVMADPASHPTTISWLIGLKENVIKSDAEWMKFLKGLAANKPMFVASFGPTPAPIESGEKLIGISMPKYIITKAPAPLDWAQVSQPMMGTPRGMAIAAGAPHPNAARLFVDYWLSQDAMKILAEKVGEYVLAPGDLSPDRRNRQGEGHPDPRAVRRRDQEVGRRVQEDLRAAVIWKSGSRVSTRTTIRKARRSRPWTTSI